MNSLPEKNFEVENIIGINKMNIDMLPNSDRKDSIENVTELLFKELENREPKKLAISNYRDTDLNLEKINYCIQNIRWDEVDRKRDEFIKHCEIHQKGNRNNTEITPVEEAEKKKFDIEKQTDIFYTFSEFFLNSEPIYNHFQLRKNLILISQKEMVYFNQKGVEMINLITSNTTQLVSFPHHESDKIICFDAVKFESPTSSIDSQNSFKAEFQVHFVFGKFNNRIIIQKVRVYEKLRKLVAETIFLQEYLISSQPDQNQLMNFVKFSENKLQIYTSCNDSYIKIFDYSNMGEIGRYKSKNCVNHFNFNHSKNIIAAVGDYEEVHLIDPKANKTINYLEGHYDYGFVSRFQPFSDYILATGNQDLSAKIWDLRKIKDETSNYFKKDSKNFNNCYNFDGVKSKNSSGCLKTYYGISNSIGDLKFIEREFLVILENSYNLHVVNLIDDNIQSIKYIGNGIGMDYSPYTHKIYFATYQPNYSGIFAFKKISNFLDYYELNSFHNL